MTRQARYKLAIVAVTLGLGLALWWALSSGGSIDFVDHGALPGAELTEETAKVIFPNLRNLGKRPRHRYDPDVGVLLAPDTAIRWEWPEAEDGWLVMVTNAQGFREDEPTPTTPPAFRVLVLGDSHTEGFVANPQSFPNVLERRIDAARPDLAPCDVINAGVGGTNPWNYARMVDEFPELRPDLVIVAFFTGNDFYGSLAMRRFLAKAHSAPEPAGYQQRLMAARDLIGEPPQRFPSAILGNGQNQAYRFKHFPDEIEAAFDAARADLADLADRCAARGAELIVLVLPTKPDVDLADDRETVRETLAVLELTETEAAINRVLGRRLVAALQSDGVRVVDPYEAMRAADEPLYWRKDYHINPAGHALVAEALFPEVLEVAR